MDFSLSDDQRELRDLARRIIERHATPEGLRAAEAREDFFHEALWHDLAGAGLLGTAIAEDAGGSGLGLIELGLILTEIGRAAAPVPIFPSLVMGALAVDRYGSPAQRARILPEVATGQRMLTAALEERAAVDLLTPVTRAFPRPDGGFGLRGEKICVPAAHLASHVLVPAATGAVDHPLILLVDPRAEGVSLERQIATNGEPRYTMRLADVLVGSDDVLIGPGPEARAALSWIVQRTQAALAAMQTGVAERALRLTADYVRERKQFGKPIATFQAVTQRIADAYIDVEAMKLSAAQAIWRLSADLPAEKEVAVAKLWAAEGGYRVTAAAQHLHGGMGVDRDYPLHRCTLWAKAIELTLGSSLDQLAQLGRALAAPSGSNP